MAMSLSFILCQSEEEVTSCSGLHSIKNEETSSAVFKANKICDSRNTARKSSTEAQKHNEDSDDGSILIISHDRTQHVRKLQNIRQRRYRDRKKLNMSVLQANADQLHQENGALELAIIKFLNS
ncbi:hypothetical protein Plhal304r1_c034g0107731 [Plasmopara halstedii]